MATYAYIEDNEIKQLYDILPGFWGNTSNFNALEGEDDYLKSLGWYKIVKNIPEYNSSNQYVTSVSHTFENDVVTENYEVVTIEQPFVPEKTQEDLATEEWNIVRAKRDALMRDFDWRYTRYYREERLTLPHTDSLVDMDTYMQALADVTLQASPFDLVWPEYILVNGNNEETP